MTMKNTYRQPNMRIQWGSYDQWTAEGLTPPPCAIPPKENHYDDIWGKATTPMGEVYFLIRPFLHCRGYMLGVRFASSKIDDVVSLVAIRIDSQEKAEVKAEVHLTHLISDYLKSQAHVASMPVIQTGDKERIEKQLRQVNQDAKGSDKSAENSSDEPPSEDALHYYYDPSRSAQQVADGVACWLRVLSLKRKFDVVPLSNGDVGVWGMVEKEDGEELDLLKTIKPGERISLDKDGNFVVYHIKGKPQPQQRQPVATIPTMHAEPPLSPLQAPPCPAVPGAVYTDGLVHTERRTAPDFHYSATHLHHPFDKVGEALGWIQRYLKDFCGGNFQAARSSQLASNGIDIRPVSAKEGEKSFCMVPGMTIRLAKDGALLIGMGEEGLAQNPARIAPPAPNADGVAVPTTTRFTYGFNQSPAEVCRALESWLTKQNAIGNGIKNGHAWAALQPNALGLGFVAIMVLFFDKDNDPVKNPAVLIPGDSLCVKDGLVSWDKGNCPPPVSLPDERKRVVVV